MAQEKEVNLDSNIKKLREIASWFNSQEEVNVEKGLEKVKKAMKLIGATRKRLKEVENEFEDLKKKMDTEENSSQDKEDVPF